MRRKTCYVFLSEVYADWEIALVMAGLHSFGDVEVITFSLVKEPVSSMGNLAVLADLSLEEVDPADIDLLVLPGSPIWEKRQNLELRELVRSVLLLDRGLAAICGATLLLAAEGYLESCRHTSNDLDYLRSFAPGYSGDDGYTFEPATRDGSIITAGGAYPVHFAREIFDFFGLSGDAAFQQWFSYFKQCESVLRKSAFFVS